MNNYIATSLRLKNTFAVDAFCPKFYEPQSVEELEELAGNLPMPFYILGEGSNTLFVAEQAPPILKLAIKGVELIECNDYFELRVAASENWHQLVTFSIENGAYGLENLALIPGSVGAAPVQNIGAYGVEFSTFCHSVDWFCFEQKKVVQMSVEQCQFGYRESIFKGPLKNKGIITAVTLRLSKSWQGKMSYAGLTELPSNASAKEIYQRVIQIRQSKLPDPKELPNAGSFFKNPIVDIDVLATIKNKFDFDFVPHYPASEGKVKLAAGWLIEKAGFKGVIFGDVGVHKHQALVLVNYGAVSGIEIAKLAQNIIKAVETQFSVTLQPEVRLIGQQGELSIEEM